MSSQVASPVRLQGSILKQIDEQERLISGWISVEVVDREGEIVDIDDLKRALVKYFDRGAPLLFAHSNKPVGRILSWEERVHPETGRRGIYVIAKIFRNYSIDDVVWELIKEGRITGFSIGGQAEKHVATSEDGGEAVIRKNLELMEVSLVDRPANPYAVIDEVNVLAKGEDCESRYMEDDRHFKLMTCPGQRDNQKWRYCGCVRYMICRGYSSEDAERICAKIKDRDEAEKAEINTPEPNNSGGAGMNLVKDSDSGCKNRYLVEEPGGGSHFKEMTCPDNPENSSRFCGCVRYFMTCEGRSLDSAKKICAYIKQRKYGKGAPEDDMLDLLKDLDKEDLLLLLLLKDDAPAIEPAPETQVGEPEKPKEEVENAPGSEEKEVGEVEGPSDAEENAEVVDAKKKDKTNDDNNEVGKSMQEDAGKLEAFLARLVEKLDSLEKRLSEVESKPREEVEKSQPVEKVETPKPSQVATPALPSGPIPQDLEKAMTNILEGRATIDDVKKLIEHVRSQFREVM